MKTGWAPDFFLVAHDEFTGKLLVNKNLLVCGLAASQLGTVYLNRVFTVRRGDYAELGELMIGAAIITLIVPLAAVALVRLLRLKVA